PAGGDTYIYYDVAFNQRHVVLPSSQTGNVVDYTRDSWARLRSQNESSTGYTVFSYDDASNPTAKKNYTTPAMTTLVSEVIHTYDGVDRVDSESDGTATRVSWTYDELTQTNGVGRLTSVSDTSGTTRFHYDARGNVTSKLITLSGLSTTYTYSYT